MIFILFGLTVAAAVALVLGLLSPRLVPVPPPATRGLVVMIYGSFLLAGGIAVGALTRDLWMPVRAAALVLPAPVPKPEPAPPPKPAPVPEPVPVREVPPKVEEPPAPMPVVRAPDPLPVTPPAAEPPAAPMPEASSPPALPPPDTGPPPEAPTRFGPKALGQSAEHLRKTLTDQGLIAEWDAQSGPLGQAVSVGKGSGLAVFAEAEDDRLYRVQVTADLGAALADLGPVARDTARLQLGLTALALAPISPQPEAVRQESDRVWQALLTRLQQDPSRPRLSETLSLAGASLRLTLTQGGKASAQLAGSDRDLDPLLDVGP